MLPQFSFILPCEKLEGFWLVCRDAFVEIVDFPERSHQPYKGSEKKPSLFFIYCQIYIYNKMPIFPVSNFSRVKKIEQAINSTVI